MDGDGEGELSWVELRLFDNTIIVDILYVNFHLNPEKVFSSLAAISP